LNNPYSRLADLPTPEKFKDIDIACKRIKKAILEKETITIVGDYDVDPDTDVMKQITALEVQDKVNEKKEKQKLAATYEADARIEKARGDSSLIVTAFYQAKAIKTMKEELAKGNSQDYINYVVWKEFSERGVSPFGNNNTFGGGQPTLTKLVK
jgi:hypothetical protein